MAPHQNTSPQLELTSLIPHQWWQAVYSWVACEPCPGCMCGYPDRGWPQLARRLVPRCFRSMAQREQRGQQIFHRRQLRHALGLEAAAGGGGSKCSL